MIRFDFSINPLVRIDIRLDLNGALTERSHLMRGLAQDVGKGKAAQKPSCVVSRKCLIPCTRSLLI